MKSDYRKNHHDKVREYEIKYAKKRSGPLKEKYANDPAYRELMIDRNRQRYGLKLGEYKVLFEAQNGVCAICKKPQESKKTKNLFVDHDHATGKVRGLLCNKCNVAMGLVNENIDTLKAIINYLENH